MLLIYLKHFEWHRQKPILDGAMQAIVQIVPKKCGEIRIYFNVGYNNKFLKKLSSGNSFQISKGKVRCSHSYLSGPQSNILVEITPCLNFNLLYFQCRQE